MYPFIDLGFILIPVYGLCIVTGIITGGCVAKFLCSQQNRNFLDFIIIATMTLCFGFITAKILYILITFPISDFFIVVAKMLFGKDNSILASGFVFLGGLPGGLLGYFLGTKIAKCKLFDFTDIFAVIIPLVHGFGRIGCFFAGCCYGRFVPGTMISFPVQLLESGVLFLLALFLFVGFMKNQRHLLFGYLFSYAMIRFFLEYLRGDTIRGYFGIFSTSQWICIGIGILSIIAVPFVIKRNEQSGEQAVTL